MGGILTAFALKLIALGAYRLQWSLDLEDQLPLQPSRAEATRARPKAPGEKPLAGDHSILEAVQFVGEFREHLQERGSHRVVPFSWLLPIGRPNEGTAWLGMAARSSGKDGSSSPSWWNAQSPSAIGQWHFTAIFLSFKESKTAFFRC